MTDIFRTILVRADMPNSDVFTADEVAAWPDGLLGSLISLGILREIAPAQEVECDQCEQCCSITPEIRDDLRTGKAVGVYFCEDVGRITVDLGRLSQWEVDFTGLANVMAGAMLENSDVKEVSLGRLYHLGTVMRSGKPRDVFMARGLAWRDAASVVFQVPRFQTSKTPIVLVPATIPSNIAWKGRKPTIVPLTDVATLGAKGVVINLACVFGTTPRRRKTGGPVRTLVPEHVMKRLREIPAKSEKYRKQKIAVWTYRACDSAEIARHVETETGLNVSASRIRQIRSEVVTWVARGSQTDLSDEQESQVRTIIGKIRKIYKTIPDSSWQELEEDLRMEVIAELLTADERSAEAAGKRFLDQRRGDIRRMARNIDPDTRKPYEDTDS